MRELSTGQETVIDSLSFDTNVSGMAFSPESNQGAYEIVADISSFMFKFNRDGTNRFMFPWENSDYASDDFPAVRRGDQLIAFSNNRPPAGVGGLYTVQISGAEARANNRLNRIGYAVEREARRNGFTVIENIGSHGVGRALHEEPGFIQNYWDARDRRILREGQVITIESFVSSGAKEVFETGDGWTLSTEQGIFTAQFEHTRVITKNKPLIMTLPA